MRLFGVTPNPSARRITVSSLGFARPRSMRERVVTSIPLA